MCAPIERILKDNCPARFCPALPWKDMRIFAKQEPRGEAILNDHLSWHISSC